MILKEEGGDSSPVHEAGTKMMEQSFYTTSKIALHYTKKRIPIYEKYLNRNVKKVLDIGCGPGVFYKPMKEQSIDWSGIEINPFWVRFAKKNNIPVSNKKMIKINEKFDVVTAHQVLEHIEKPNFFLEEIKEKLKIGGILHLELPNQKSLTSNLRMISPSLSYDYGFIQPPMHLRAYSEKTLSYLLNRNGFKIIKLITCSNNHKVWGQVRKYSVFQKAMYSFSGLINRGSLLIGLAMKT